MSNTVDKKLKLISKISEIADSVTLEYVKGLSKTINDSDADDEQKAKALQENCLGKRNLDSSS